MKRNLFAIFLAVMLVAALVFVVAPSAKAADTSVVQVTDNGTITVDTSKILDLNGKNVTVTVGEGETLYVIDTANNTKDGTANAGTLTNNGTGSVAVTAQDPSTKMRYVAIKEGDTYTVHPFNLTISQIGINTLAGENNDEVAICLRPTYFANDKVVNSAITDYGVCTVVDGVPGNPVSAKAYYSIDGKNLLHAYFDLTGSLSEDKIDKPNHYCAYMVVNGETVYSSSVAEVTPREVLKSLNGSVAEATEAQKTRIDALMETNARVKNILTGFRAEFKDVTLSFASTANRVSQTSAKQVWEVNGVVFTNDKSSSTSDIIDSSNPVRLYKSSKITITAGGITKIVFNCNSTSYASSLQKSIGSAATVSSKVVTVVFAEAVDSFSATLSDGQVRLDSIVVSASIPAVCEHMVNVSEASCTAKAVCIDCDKEHGGFLAHVEKTAATCTEKAICENCNNAYGSTIPHDYPVNSHDCTYGCDVKSDCEYADGSCTICGAADPNADKTPELLATFTFGSNGAASHADGSSKTSYSETNNGFTLSLSGMSGVYTGARDAKGNSCIKLGAKSSAGKFSLTVPENVTSVVIYVAGYKDSTAKINVNGTASTVTTTSNNGAYTAITIDTSSTKTISFTTVSGGYRAMVNTIEFIGYAE